ncbi:hypothetical protein ACFPM0_16445 [Pseudonocardia sulfidoxydans]
MLTEKAARCVQPQARRPCDHRDLCGLRSLRVFFDLHLVCVFGGLLPG